MSRFPGSWGLNLLIRHQMMAEWLLNERWLSFHCPLRDHTIPHWGSLPLSSSCYKPITKPTGVFIIKFRLQPAPLTLAHSPMPCWALSQGVVITDGVSSYLSCCLKTTRQVVNDHVLRRSGESDTLVQLAQCVIQYLLFFFQQNLKFWIFHFNQFLRKRWSKKEYVR